MAIAILERMLARQAIALPQPDSGHLAHTLHLKRRIRAGDSDLERDIAAAIDSGAAKTRLEAERLMAQFEAQAPPPPRSHWTQTASSPPPNSISPPSRRVCLSL